MGAVLADIVAAVANIWRDGSHQIDMVDICCAVLSTYNSLSPSTRAKCIELLTDVCIKLDPENVMSAKRRVLALDPSLNLDLFQSDASSINNDEEDDVHSILTLSSTELSPRPEITMQYSDAAALPPMPKKDDDTFVDCDLSAYPTLKEHVEIKKVCTKQEIKDENSRLQRAHIEVPEEYIPYLCRARKENKNVCMRLNHMEGKGCIREDCSYDHICMVCLRSGHGPFQLKKDSTYACDFMTRYDTELELAKSNGVDVSDFN